MASRGERGERPGGGVDRPAPDPTRRVRCLERPGSGPRGKMASCRMGRQGTPIHCRSFGLARTDALSRTEFPSFAMPPYHCRCAQPWDSMLGRRKVRSLSKMDSSTTLTPGGLSHLLHRTARDAAPTYTALCEQVRNSPVVTPDETGWRVGAISHWLWAFVTPETTVYAICPGRGFDDATTVLGADFDGVLVRDGWVSYRCYRAALHQSCLNHLLRRCKELQEDHPDSLWAGQVQAVLQTGLAVRDRCNDGELSEHGLASVRGRLVARLGRLIDRTATAGRRRALCPASGHRPGWGRWRTRRRAGRGIAAGAWWRSTGPR